MTSHVRRALGLTALSAALALSAAAGPAASAQAWPTGAEPARAATGPGSIVFVRDHDVWLARGDGTGLYRVTDDGTRTTPYISPSQSDDGVIAVGHGPHVVVMTQNGTVLKRMDPPALQNEVSHPLDGPPVQVAISPDGSLVAYTFSAEECAVGVPCDAYRATGITRTDRLDPAARYGQTYFWSPSWVGNERTIQSGGYLYQVMFKDLGQEPVHWFDDHDLPEVEDGFSTDLDDVELSPDGDWAAAVRGYGDTATIAWFRVSGNAQSGPPPAVPDWVCVTSELRGLASPTFAPDSGALAWQEPDGIWSVAPDGTTCHDPALLIPDAGQPDWSAAPLAPEPRRFELEQKPGVSGTARVGATLTASPGRWAPTPARVEYRWLRSGRPIARADGQRYRLTPTDRGERISVRVTVSGPSRPAASATSRPTGKVRPA